MHGRDVYNYCMTSCDSTLWRFLFSPTPAGNLVNIDISTVKEKGTAEKMTTRNCKGRDCTQGEIQSLNNNYSRPITDITTTTTIVTTTKNNIYYNDNDNNNNVIVRKMMMMVMIVITIVIIVIVSVILKTIIAIPENTMSDFIMCTG